MHATKCSGVADLFSSESLYPSKLKHLCTFLFFINWFVCLVVLWRNHVKYGWCEITPHQSAVSVLILYIRGAYEDAAPSNWLINYQLWRCRVWVIKQLSSYGPSRNFRLIPVKPLWSAFDSMTRDRVLALALLISWLENALSICKQRRKVYQGEIMCSATLHCVH